MAISLINNAAGGTNGAAVSYTNSGETSGDMWDFINIGTNASITFANSPARGNLSYKCTTGVTSTTASIAWFTQFPEVTTAYVRFNVFLPSYPSGSIRFCEISDPSSVAISVGMTAAGKISIRDSPAAQVALSTMSVPLNQWVRIELKCVFSATAGQVIFRMFTEVDSPYPAEKITSATTFNTKPNTAYPSRYRFGLVGINIANYTYYLDDVTVNDSTFAGPANAASTSPLLLYNDAETSTTGTSVSSVNSGDSVNKFFNYISAPGAVTYSSSQKAHGSLSYLFQPANGVDDMVSWRIIATSAAALRVYAYFTGFPSGPSEFAQLTTSSSGTFTQLARVGLLANGKVRVLDSSTNIWDSAAAISLNTWYRFEIFASIGGSATTGTMNVAYYGLDSTTAIDNFSTTNANLGLVNFGSARFGKLNVDDWTSQFYMDDFAVRQQASGFIGPTTGPPAAPAAYGGAIPYLGWGTRI